jgi:hypothetical protein
MFGTGAAGGSRTYQADGARPYLSRGESSPYADTHDR